MAEKICIIGESGSGKSTSLRNMDPKETFVLGIVKKSLPIKGSRRKFKPFGLTSKEAFMGNHISGIREFNAGKPMADYQKVIYAMQLISQKRPDIKTLVIDDLQYLMSIEFVDRATEKGFDKFSELAQHIMKVIQYADVLRDDLTVIFMTHSENAGTPMEPILKIKTIGRMLDEKVTLEGLFTYVMFSKVIEEDAELGKFKYVFVTNNDGECVAKTPYGVFDELYIDNDLNAALEKINKYEYGDDEEEEISE